MQKWSWDGADVTWILIRDSRCTGYFTIHEARDREIMAQYSSGATRIRAHVPSHPGVFLRVHRAPSSEEHPKRSRRFGSWNLKIKALRDTVPLNRTINPVVRYIIHTVSWPWVRPIRDSQWNELLLDPDWTTVRRRRESRHLLGFPMDCDEERVSLKEFWHTRVYIMATT